MQNQYGALTYLIRRGGGEPNARPKTGGNVLE